MIHDRAGQLPLPQDLVDLRALEVSYFDIKPDASNPAEKVSFGTSGHRGSSLNGSFNENHVLAITQAIVEHRASSGISGPIYIGRDTHALSDPCQQSVLEVLAGNGIDCFIAKDNGFTPTPAVSVAILDHNLQVPRGSDALADGIVITPSHNPPSDGGIKYNPPHGGPADSDITNRIANRANELLLGALVGVKRAQPKAQEFDFQNNYISQLDQVLHLETIAQSGIRIGADPLGGASVAYWDQIAHDYKLDLTVLNHSVDPEFGFMSLDWDGKIRMDCSSEYAMASLIENKASFDISTGNDADADRHGIVTADSGLMNPNHFLTVAIHYLFDSRPGWDEHAGIGKTMVSSSMINRVATHLNRKLIEVPVGFKWFVSGLQAGTLGFGGEESAGASFLRLNGQPFSTDKDGIIMCLLASEIEAAAKTSPSEQYAELTQFLGEPSYRRIDAPATIAQKQVLAALSESDIVASSLAGEGIENIETKAANGGSLGGIKVTTENAWFAARPSGTEDVYKIYGESFNGSDHLDEVLQQAQSIVDAVISSK
ncbi:phosphoglucomutase (alpha-D-glucose-1,6-bisphosphate-dependent) [Aquiluna sp.]|nr:phosphoglucomutase (alpha-D-glucose-1,6-bisphosphate-dependent) [Aquiluna sp.]MDA8901782.1 phosphoglucomutase (alpha-D-glucose-1,6-bisphosphate-dependent) [Aquiluna sp.]